MTAYCRHNPYVDGRKAFAAGTPYSACPFVIGTHNSQRWKWGWRAAETDAKEARDGDK